MIFLEPESEPESESESEPESEPTASASKSPAFQGCGVVRNFIFKDNSCWWSH